MDLKYGLVMRGLLKVDEKILILKRHPKSTTNPNKWELPGGKVFVFPNQNIKKGIII